MANTVVFLPNVSGQVSTATTGALTGDGTSGNKLAVAVDGVTLDVNGSNQIAVQGNLGTATEAQREAFPTEVLISQPDQTPYALIFTNDTKGVTWTGLYVYVSDLGDAAIGGDGGLNISQSGYLSLAADTDLFLAPTGNLKINNTNGVSAGPFSTISSITVTKGIITAISGS